MVTGSAVDLGVDAIDGEVFAPYLSGDGRTAVLASNGRGLDPGVPTLRVTTYVASLDAAGGTRPAPPPVQNAPGTLPTLTGDLPVVGDWNGDGTDTIGVFRRGTWLLRNVNVPGPIDRSVLWGAGDDIPAAGDWDGDGTFGLGVRRVGAWLQRETPRFRSYRA